MAIEDSILTTGKATKENMSRPIDRALDWLVVWVLVVSALGMGGALSGHFLVPQIVILSLLITVLYIRHSLSIPVNNGGPGVSWSHLVLILLVGIFFRLPPYNYVLGGQDEGVYVNMAHYIAHSGTAVPYDAPLEKLQGSEFRNLYLQENRAAGAFLPGVYYRDAGGDRLEFQFYHLFPVWMAIFIGLFGGAYSVYALTFFSILSLIFFYKLALVASGSTRTALVAGLLLALNPLHVFFSKFPVTEVMALSFSLMGFTYLATYCTSNELTRRGGALIISALCFGELFATRISGFMYIPFFLALAIATAILDSDRKRKNGIALWVAGVVVLYGFSVLYGLRWSEIYAGAIYDISFRIIFGAHWRILLAGAILAACASLVFIYRLSRSQDNRERLERCLLRPARVAIGPVMAVGLIVGFVKIYRLGWTDAYASDYVLGQLWSLAGSGWHALAASSLAGLLVYLGPLVPTVFLILVWRRLADPCMEFLRVFVAGFVVYAAALQWIMPYGPYYARYLLSELLPYMLLFVVLAWGSFRVRSSRILAAALVITALYSTFASSQQLGKSENAGLYTNLDAFLQPIDSGDVALIGSFGKTYPNMGQIKTPLVYALHKNVISVSTESLHNRPYISALNGLYDDVYLISPNATAPDGFSFLRSARINVWAFRWGYWFPRKLDRQSSMRLYLYILSKQIVGVGEDVPFGSTSPWTDWLASGWSQPESWGVWSSGNRSVIEIDRSQLPKISQDERLVMRFHVNALVAPTHPTQRVAVYLGGEKVHSFTVSYPNNSADFEVAIPSANDQRGNKIDISFDLPDAVRPKSLGMGADSRLLAIGLVSMSISTRPVP